MSVLGGESVCGGGGGSVLHVFGWVGGERVCVLGVEWRDCECWGGWGGMSECVGGERVCLLEEEWRDCMCMGGGGGGGGE